ncbi:MAG: tetraacyldisaccharide 4'-kinase [Gammaproteobacteria bacterium]
MRFQHWLYSVWYENARGRVLLLPLSWLFGLGLQVRQLLYRIGLLRRIQVAAPVIVVGNLTVGGTGKTPLVIWLAKRLAAKGMHPAVVSRGYGARKPGRLRHARADSDPAETGDEPVLIARRTGMPVLVSADRAEAARIAVLEGANVIIADDGLQHYRLMRDCEIVVVDGERRLGNEALLPAGPLREGPERLCSVAAIVVNDGEANKGELVMHVVAEEAVPLNGGETLPLSDFTGRTVHAVAGIGNPERFFTTLQSLGIDVLAHRFPDHAAYRRRELEFDDDLPVLMTEKDAVKCTAFALSQTWFVPVRAVLDDLDARELLQRIDIAIENSGNWTGK